MCLRSGSRSTLVYMRIVSCSLAVCLIRMRISCMRNTIHISDCARARPFVAITIRLLPFASGNIFHRFGSMEEYNYIFFFFFVYISISLYLCECVWCACVWLLYKSDTYIDNYNQFSLFLIYFSSFFFNFARCTSHTHANSMPPFRAHRQHSDGMAERNSIVIILRHMMKGGEGGKEKEKVSETEKRIQCFVVSGSNCVLG